jgi:hypothetical protein
MLPKRCKRYAANQFRDLPCSQAARGRRVHYTELTFCAAHRLTGNPTSLERQDAYSRHVQRTCSICFSKPRETTHHERPASHITISVRPP